MTTSTHQLDGNALRRLVLAAADAIEANVDELSRLDAAVGDGDHGVNVVTAMRHARSGLSDLGEPTPADVLKVLSGGFLDAMGGAAGALFGSLFKTVARSLGPATEIGSAELADGLQKGVDVVIRRGGTQPGDKTMVDALCPAVAAANDAAAVNAPLSETLSLVAAAARSGAETTRDMTASRGRAQYAGQRAVGVQDAGATTVALIFEAWATAITEGSDG